ncbi:aspartate/glutamate racemase family protein [Sorangium sp. So ce1014]|uniref:aspartate/glutamate racemase family protein n=1 Tax=Sorangium sp. So ce1014 TaxID=3133326 RepID=UPI003F606326
MKTIGLIGGMSWESSLYYYRIINEAVKQRLGGLHSAECLMFSVDFAPIEKMQAQGRWQDAGQVLADAAVRLERAGAGFLVLCTNTMHKVAGVIEERTRLPLLHIADATGAEIRHRRLRRVGLLGTRFTMEQDFYRQRLTEQHDLDVLIPNEAERETIHRVIYDELCLGQINPSSRQKYLAIIENLVAAGAEGIILGCTEIMLLVGQQDVQVPVFDTTRIHAVAAAERALEGEPAQLTV